MMVLTKTAAVSTFNSEYDGPLAMDGHWGNLLPMMASVNSAKDLKRKRIGHNVKSVQSGFIPRSSNRQRKYSFSLSSSEFFSYVCDICVSKKSVFDVITEMSLRFTELTIVINRINKNYGNCVRTKTTEQDANRKEHIKKTSLYSLAEV